jgi:sugar lactone lactonase YvrE
LLYQDVTQDGRRGELWIARADGGTQRLLAKSASSPAWSPDSRLIAFNDTVVDVNGRRVAGLGARDDRARRPAAVGSTR